MNARIQIATIALAALIAPAGRAQVMGGMGGFGGAGAGRPFGGLSDSLQGGSRSPKASWRPWLGMNGTYVDNPVYLDSSGQITRQNDQRGANGSWGVSGLKQLERSSFGGTYMGSVFLNSTSKAIRGSSHAGTFGASHRFNRNLFAGVQQMFGSTLGGYGAGAGFAGLGSGLFGFSDFSFGQIGLGNPLVNSFVDEEIFANRVNFSGTSASMGYQLSLRSMIEVQAGAQFVRRNNRQLSNFNGYFGGASYSYSLNRSTFLGVNYRAGHFGYPNRFGGNRVQSLGLFAGRRLSDRASIAGGAGANYFDSSFIGTVALAPELAATLGIAAVTQVQTAQRLTWGGEFLATYRSDIASFSLLAQRGVSPGNGILFGGIRDIVAANVSRSFLESKLTTTWNASLSRNSGILQAQVQTRYQTGVWVSYRFPSAGLFLNAGGGLRWQRLALTGPYLPSKVVTVGLGWSPGEQPLFF